MSSKSTDQFAHAHCVFNEDFFVTYLYTCCFKLTIKARAYMVFIGLQSHNNAEKIKSAFLVSLCVSVCVGRCEG